MWWKGVINEKKLQGAAAPDEKNKEKDQEKKWNLSFGIL